MKSDFLDELKRDAKERKRRVKVTRESDDVATLEKSGAHLRLDPELIVAALGVASRHGSPHLRKRYANMREQLIVWLRETA